MSREKTHAGFKRALDLGVTMAEISRQTGIGYESLRAFRSTHALGDENLAKLEKWLEERARVFTPRDEALDPKHATDAVEEMGILLHNLGAFLRSTSFPLAQRVEYLKTNLRAINELVPELERIAKKDARTVNSRPKA